MSIAPDLNGVRRTAIMLQARILARCEDKCFRDLKQ